MKRFFQKQTDEEVVQLIRQGNKNILLQLYKTHFASVQKFIESSGGNKGDAEELLQDALTQLWTEVNLPEFSIPFTLKDYLMHKVRAAWRSKHDESL